MFRTRIIQISVCQNVNTGSLARWTKGHDVLDYSSRTELIASITSGIHSNEYGEATRERIKQQFPAVKIFWILNNED